MTYIINDTPLEDHRTRYGLLVKREDLCCPLPGPPFSKTRGVLRAMQAQVNAGQTLFGVLDTVHSQGGLAVAQAAQYLGVQCVDYYPVYKADAPGLLRPVQVKARELGAELFGLPAGRSAVLYHEAKRRTLERGGWMYPNALKLDETVDETAAEVDRTFLGADDDLSEYMTRVPWIVSASSATIAAGVLKGLDYHRAHPYIILHMGYSRSEDSVKRYLAEKSQRLVTQPVHVDIIDEGYDYADEARPGETPPWACNSHYDLKAFRWWMNRGRSLYGEAVFWNIG